METKTWKLGEVCQGGIITVNINDKVITVIGKEWDFTTGSRKSSNQSNAKEFIRGNIIATDTNAENQLESFLTDLATSYHAGLIIDWIKSKVEFKSNDVW